MGPDLRRGKVQIPRKNNERAMTFIHIKKIQKLDANNVPVEAFAVPCVVITTPQGRKLIPNPAGTEAELFDTLESAESAIKRAGFDYVFEGKMTSTLAGGKPVAAVVTGNERSWETAIPSLINHLKDRETSVVANSAFALGALRAQAAIEPLCELLGHDDPNVRKSVAEAFGRLGMPAIYPLRDALVKARSSPQNNASHVRLTVLTAFLEMIEENVGAGIMTLMIPMALESLDDENWLVRSQAAMIVARATLSIEAEKLRQENQKRALANRRVD